MKVTARAVIWIDGQLIVCDEVCGEHRELLLPGGRVSNHESVIDALKRRVAEGTGLEIVPGRLLYVSAIGTHDLELIFLAETRGIPSLSAFQAIDIRRGQMPAVRPPILDQIAQDVASSWRDTPRWLGSLEAVTVPNAGPTARA